MKIQFTSAINNNTTQRQSFKATPQQIIAATEKLNGTVTAKKSFLLRIAKFFQGIQTRMEQMPESPNQLTYSLVEKNVIPKELERIHSVTNLCNDITLKEFDKAYSEIYKTTGKKDLSLNLIAANMLKELNVPEPTVIKITKI